MKKLLSLFLCMILAVFLASPALALTINTLAIDVGNVDDIDLLNSTTLPNSGNAEQTWIDGLFPDAIVDVIDTVASDWVQVDGEDYIWAYELPMETDKFFIKVGTGGTNLKSHIAYDNNISLLYAVVDLRDWALLLSAEAEAWTEATIPNNINIGRVSHVGAPVPEPSTILLLGLGLVGIAGIGRKKIKS